MKEQPNESRKTAEQRNAELKKMTEKQMLDYVNKTLEADQTSLEEKLSPVREMIRGLSKELFAPPKRERTVRETDTPDTDYVQAEQTMRDLQGIRNRQRNPEINRNKQFDLVNEEMRQSNKIENNTHDLGNERNAVQSEHAPNYENTVVNIGIVDEQGMHTVRVHSAEEAAKALSAAYGWETPEQDNSPSPAEPMTYEQDLRETRELEEALELEEQEERAMEDFGQAMADTWNEREEQFRKDMDSLER